MKHLRLLAVSSIAVFAAYGGLVACSDDTVITDPPGTEAGSDAPNPPPPDGGETDAGPDVVFPPTEAGTPAEFAQLAAEAMCESLARCCYGNPNLGDDAGIPDGGNFKKTACVEFYKRLGFEGSNVGILEADASAVNIDNVKGGECVAKLRALTCDLTGTELASARTACFAALSGKGATGAPCNSPVECGPNAFCLYSDAGTGAGTCQPLRGDGGNCSDNVQHIADDDIAIAFAEEACSYRRGGTPALRCDNYDYVSGQYRDRADWRCMPTVASGGNCNFSNWCTNEVCNGDPNYACVPQLDYFAGLCEFYR